MAFPVTLNGTTYTLADFEGLNYVEGFPDALEDFVTEAAAKVTAAETAETNAETAETNASASATAAASSATAAAASATSAAASLDAIEGFYLGAAASDPTVDLNGDALTAGDWYFNTGSDALKVYNGTTFITFSALTFDVVDDTTPQLGGNLDVNGNSFVTTSNGNIVLDPNGTGEIHLSADTGIGTTSPTSTLHVKDSTTARVHIEFDDTAPSTFDGSGSGVLLTSDGMNTTNKFTPAIQFGTTDSSLTTTNPKVGAAINAISTETYSTDSKGGMALAFYTTENGPGTGQATTERVRIDENGTVIFNNGITEQSTSITSSSNAATIDLEDGTFFEHDLTENVTYTFSNPGASGTASGFVLKVIQGSTARTITWPSSVDWPGGTAPTLSTGNDNVDVFVFFTIDNGTTYYGFTAGQAMA